jgi:3-mercaptopyruvate sulfurtransferase SseA
MKIYGHRDVRIMNGGRKKWLSDSLDLGDRDAAVTPTTYQRRRRTRRFVPSCRKCRTR